MHNGSCLTVATCNFREIVVRKSFLFTNIALAVITTNLWRQLKSSGIRPISASTCSSLRWTDFPRTPVMLGSKMVRVLVMCVGLMGQFLIVLFLTIFTNWTSAGHGLCLAGHNGVLDFALGEAFATLADGLNHGHGVHGLHVDVGESTAYTILLSEEGDFFAPGGGDNPVATSVVAASKSVRLQLGEREEIGDAVAD
jgi:hypothetical protein